MNGILTRLAKPRFWQTALACYWAALLVSTHVPRDFPGVPSHGVDKLVHVAAFAVLAGLVAMNLQLAGGHVTRHHIRWLWIAVVLYAAVDELTQPVVGRVASWIDWLADAAGAAIGLALFALVRALSCERRL